MTIVGDRPPELQTLLGVVDKAATAAVRAARREVAPVVAAQTPRGRTGTLARELRPRTVRTRSGVGLVVGARRGRPHGRYATVAQVVRWVNRGTADQRASGVHGPRGRIVPTRPWGSLILPGGRRYKSVAGQKPNPFMSRIRAIATLRVQRTFARGADDAARAAERAF